LQATPANEPSYNKNPCNTARSANAFQVDNIGEFFDLLATLASTCVSEVWQTGEMDPFASRPKHTRGGADAWRDLQKGVLQKRRDNLLWRTQRTGLICKRDTKNRFFWN